MERKGWSARVVLRYALLQVPFTALVIVVLIWVRKWVDLPIWFICGLVAFLVIKDIVLFPFVWRAYDPDSPALTNTMEGARGIGVLEGEVLRVLRQRVERGIDGRQQGYIHWGRSSVRPKR